MLTLRDILLMNGYTYADMMGKTGKGLSVTLDGRHIVLRGEPSVPAILRLNEAEASLSAVVHAGDRIDFVAARQGADVVKTLGELLGEEPTGRVLVNNREASMDTLLRTGDVILTLDQLAEQEELPVIEKVQSEPAPPAPMTADIPQPEAKPVMERSGTLHVILNEAPLILEPKENGAPYYLMDLLQYSGIDFEHLNSPVRLEVNGVERGFQHQLRDGDIVTICCVSEQ